MKSQLAQDTTNSAKTLAQQIARQMAREPLEVLKTAKEQTTGSETPGLQNVETPGLPTEQNTQIDQKEQTDKLKSLRRIEALNREISDIKRQKLFSSLQKKISDGEEVPLYDYPDLSIEQKQVLKAQMEAVAARQQNNLAARQLVEPEARKGRRLFNFGKKTEVKRQQTHVEKIVPPSG